MSDKKDYEQDEQIRQNAARITRNEESIRRQTEALEKICDHYYPKKTVWKRFCALVIKVVGIITVYAGLMETFEWYMNTRTTESIADQSVAVARRLLSEENDLSGAKKFLERASELDDTNAKYKTMLGYVKGMAAIVDFFELSRPLQSDECARIDDILAEAIFLQTAAPDNPMPYVLTAQAYALRREFTLADQAIGKAIALDPENVLVHCSGCAMRYFAQDFEAARREIAEAARLHPDFPIVLYWKGLLAAEIDHDLVQAREHFEKMLRLSPRLPIPHAMLGWIQTLGEKPDYPAARKEYAKALAVNPRMKNVMFMMGETFERENQLIVAELWYSRALACDARHMRARMARARVKGLQGDWKASEDDWTVAIGLDPFRAELYSERAKARTETGNNAGADADRKTAEALKKNV